MAETEKELVTDQTCTSGDGGVLPDSLVSGLNSWHDQPLIRWEHRRASGDGGGKEASLLEFLRHHRKGV